MRRLAKFMLLSLALLTVSCATKEVLLVSYHSSTEETKGLPRLAQDSVRVIMDQTGEIGQLDNAAGLYLVPEAEMVALIKAAKELQGLKAK